MTTVLTGLAALVVFGAVVLVHEAGHFLAARHCGIHVAEFSVGMGPRLFSRVKNGTRYSLRAFPLGGYNLFTLPPEAEDGDEAETAAPVLPPPRCPRRAGRFPFVAAGADFEEATAWQRFFVTLCGAAMNFLLGAALLVVLVVFFTTALGSTTVAAFNDDAVSSACGLELGDEILAVNGTRVRTVRSLLQAAGDGSGTYDLAVLRGGRLVNLSGVRFARQFGDNGALESPLDFKVAKAAKTPRTVLTYAGELFCDYATAILDSFYQMLTGQVGLDQLSGPVGTVTVIGQAVQYGLADLLSLAALLTINVGVFNLLPIPGLDGFKLLFLLCEAVTGYVVPPRVQAALNAAGMVLLLWLMIFVTFQDFTRFVG